MLVPFAGDGLRVLSEFSQQIAHLLARKVVGENDVISAGLIKRLRILPSVGRGVNWRVQAAPLGFLQQQPVAADIRNG